MTSSLQTQKRKLEQEIQAIHSDLEDQLNELKVSEEHSKKAMADAARLAEELRQEQVRQNIDHCKIEGLKVYIASLAMNNL